jgi:unsaturated pyranuronate lyase
MPVIVGHEKLASVPEEHIGDKITRKVISGEQGMMVWWHFKAGGIAAAHQHPHEQISWMIRGRMDLRIGSEKRSMVAGDVAVIPGGVEHEAYFPEDTELVDFFAPARQDFLAGGAPAYMRQS